MKSKKKGIAQRFTIDELREQFTAFSREPFVDILSHLVGCAPTEERLQEFANEYPDKWASACLTFSRLVGYNDKLEIHGNVAIEIHSMGDAQLIDRIEDIQRKLVELGSEDYKEITLQSSEPSE